jgi:ABC-type bacteriocin/lantibiotic exporter with double-glycine peptidase domain
MPTLLVLVLLLAGRPAAGEGKTLWVDVPFVEQAENGCGAASLAMILKYWGRTAPAPQDIMSALFRADVKGIPSESMVKYLQDRGFRTFAFAGEWADLEQHLQKGRPLIVCLRAGPSTPYHYVVVAGVDPPQRIVLVNDPAVRKLHKLRRTAFEAEWRRSNNWTLLAVPLSSK